MTANLSTTLRRRRRASDPMRDYDRLPPPLRGWLTQAALPWSPASCLRLWRRARAEGADAASILARLDQAERHRLARDAFTRSAGLSGAAHPDQDYSP